MKSTLKMSLGLAAGLAASTAMTGASQAEDLTLCWAAWDPANALVELSKDFTAETGIGMKFEFVPWTNYADRFLNELNSKGKLCDLIIGDSQWIGGSAENGHYVKLNDFFDKEGIKMSDFVPTRPSSAIRNGRRARRTTGRCRRWATWSAGPTARTGSPSPSCRRSSRRSTAGIWPRRRPSTSSSRSPNSSRTARSTARRSTAPRSTPSAARKASPWASWTCSIPSASNTRTRTSPTTWKASSTPTKSVKGLEFYKSLYDCCTPPGASNSYMGEGVDAFKSGQVAMHMNFAFTWPGLQKDEAVGGDKIGFFANPAGPDGEQFAQLGGQGISVVSYSDKQEAALQVHQVVRQAGRAEEMVVARRLLLPEGGGRRPGLRRDASPTRRPSSTRWRS